MRIPSVVEVEDDMLNTSNGCAFAAALEHFLAIVRETSLHSRSCFREWATIILAPSSFGLFPPYVDVVEFNDH